MPERRQLAARLRRRGVTSLRAVAALLVLAWSVVPILLVVSASLKSPRDIFADPPQFLFAPTLSNYTALWQRWPEFFHNLLNSLIVTIGATVCSVLASLLAGYVYSRVQNRVLAASATLMLALRLLPPIVLVLPLFPVVNWLGLNDTRLLLIILYSALFVSLGTIIMKTFIDQIPPELEEAAVIDGAGTGQLLLRIVFPLAAQGLLAVAIFVIVFAWNEFLFAFIFTSTTAKTAPMSVSEMIGAVDGVDWGVLFAAATIQLVPIVLLVLLAQRYVVAGLTAGAVKG